MRVCMYRRGYSSVLIIPYIGFLFCQSQHSSPMSVGHSFKTAPVSRPRGCDVCSEIIWQESLVCTLCQFTIHTDICEEKVTEPCPGNSNTSNNDAEVRPSVAVNVVGGAWRRWEKNFSPWITQSPPPPPPPPTPSWFLASHLILQSSNS